MTEHTKEHRAAPTLRLMVAIVDKQRGKPLLGILREEHERFYFAMSGMGTASSEILDLLGLGSEEKTIVCCMSLHFRASALMEVVAERLRLKQPGNGIAFTIPLSGVCSPLGRQFTGDAPELRRGMELFKNAHPELGGELRDIHSRMAELNTELHQLKERWVSLMEKEAAKTQGDIDHSLIVAVINQGCSDDLMDAAKSAGARGGTVVHARRIGMEDVVKFFGISVQEEKEVVAILTRRDTKREIMQAINRSCGLATDAKGIVFSLPVDSIAGVDL